MALLTDKETTKELKDRLSEYTQFGMVLSYMLEIDKININDLESMFFDKDQEKSILIYTKLLKKIDQADVEKAFSLYSHEYPNEENLNNKNYNTHLNTICVNNILNKIVEDKKGIDKTYINTYNYLLSKSDNSNYAFRK